MVGIILQYVTYEGEVVLDSFAGSGVVGEAALNIKRSCILIEILKENIKKKKLRFGDNIFFQTVME
jgi:site-specific DNA-methyltransferase (adenine-specific)